MSSPSRKRAASRTPSPSPLPQRRLTDVLPVRLRSPTRGQLTREEVGAIHALSWMEMGSRTIAQVMGTSRDAVLAALRTQGPSFRSEDGTILGHLRVVTPRLVMSLTLTAVLNPAWTIRDSRESLMRRLGLHVTSATARRTLLALGITRYRRVYRPLLKPKHIAERFAFCNMCLMYRDWADTIIFTDESYIEYSEDGDYVTCLPGCRPYSSTRPKRVHRFLIWSAVGHHVGLMPFVVIPLGSTVDRQLYQRLILRRFVPWIREHAKGRKVVFQQDGASAHTAEGTTDVLDAAFAMLRADGVNIRRLSRWPANSPDISPIESVWAVLKAMLKRLRRQRIPLWMGLTVAHTYINRRSLLDKLWASWVRALWSVVSLGGGNCHAQSSLGRRISVKDAHAE
eukprot:TRINITY_DN44_c1_g1_i3.p1 TRINITY_DN44_c1_g1~~TRINITY_DN44_c1_g1_i3.p1  ORF type:complete len:397 (-),score=11.01 TRINITY_DN44_c1_g1_i3:128-1318(-)